MNGFIDVIVAWITNNPECSISVVFIIAVIESLAIVGVLFPGSGILATIGILLGTGALPLYPTLLAAACGGILGDTISYFIGRYYRDDIHTKWPFTKFQKLIKHGEVFFEDHGKKSVFIARFVGPVRPIVPLVAGSLKMRFRPFFITDIISGLLWAPVYMLPGAFIAFTGYTFNFKAKEIIYYGVILIALCFIGIWLYKIFLKRFFHKIDRLLLKIWQNQHPKTFHLYKINIPVDDKRATTPDLLLASLIAFIVFCFITYQSATNGFLTQWNLDILHATQSINFGELFDYIVAYTLLAEPFVMVGLYVTILSYFIYSKNFKFAFLWFINGAMAGGGAFILKAILNLQRPPGIEMRDTSSFPSAHTTLIIALFGYLYFLIRTKENKIWLGISIALMAFLMMTSRLLLSAHWFTDVLGGLFFGMTCLLFNAAIMQGMEIRKKEKRNIAIISSICLILLWSYQVVLNLDTAIDNYSNKLFENFAFIL